MTRPGAGAALLTDLGTLSGLAPVIRAAAPGLDGVQLIAELRDRLAAEVDYGQEAAAQTALQAVLRGAELDRDLDAAVEHVMSGFAQLSVHPDVPDGVRALRASGRRLITLTNGSTQVSERLVTTAGIREEFEELLSVEAAGIWKPARGAYEYAARTCGTEPADMLLVGVHPWDIDSAGRAGMRTGWLNRTGAPYPRAFRPPTLQASDLNDLAAQLG